MISIDEKAFNTICSYDKILFIDESGNEGIDHLDKENVSSFYVVGALIADYCLRRCKGTTDCT